MSKSLLEAAYLKKPLLASDVPGCREIVINNKNGFLFSIAYCTPYKKASPSAAAMDAPKKLKSDATEVILMLCIVPHATIIPQLIPVFFLAVFNLSL